ncbi:MAG: dirigent protein [Gammaproteobacteria bacterium]|nr:dirigent protein [Gammaproteobacteria bacterium]
MDIRRVLVLAIIVFLVLMSFQVSADDKTTIVTFADGRADGGIRQAADSGDGLDSPGDVFVFDQKLLASDSNTVIGRNAGYCIRTDPGAPDFSSTDHPSLPDDPNNNFGQCTWTLSFEEKSGYSGTIIVSGREADIGTSMISIIGGTGDFMGASGVMSSTPIPQEENGVLFKQVLTILRSIDIDDK